MAILDIILVVAILAGTIFIFAWRWRRNRKKITPTCPGCKLCK